MTVPAATIAAISDILQTQYLPVLERQFPEKRVLEQILEKNTDDVEGLIAKMAIHVEGNTGVGYRSDGGDLPTPGNQQYKQIEVPMRYFYGRCSFSGPAVAASKSQAASFARVMEEEMTRLGKDMRRLANVINYLDGSGVLALVDSVVDANNIIVDRWSNAFVKGRVLDSFTDKTFGTQHMDSKAIATADRSNLKLTITEHGASAGDVIVLEDSAGICQMGLIGISDDGTLMSTFQGLAVASNPIWKGVVLGNGGNSRTISEALLMDAMALFEEEEVEANLLLGTIFQRNDLIKELSEKRRFVGTDKTLKGGIKYIEIGDVPFTWDRDNPRGHTFIMDKNMLSFYQQTSGLQWMGDDGSILSRIQNKDAYEATLRCYRELGTKKRKAVMRLDDVKENRIA
jgi:hypothetical protein